MAAQQTYLIEGKDSEVVNLYIELSITTATTIDVIASAATVFNRAFSATPKVLGTNAPRSGALVTADPTLTGISLYVRGFSGSALAAGQLLCCATLQGRLA